MSTSYMVYVGPYVCCKTKIEKREREVWACPSEPCSQFSKEVGRTSIHCSACGKKLEMVGVNDLQPAIDPGEVIEKFDQRLINTSDDQQILSIDDPVEHFYRSNITEGVPRDFHFDPVDQAETLVVQSLNQANIKREIAWFNKFYRREIGVLIQTYGLKNTKVMWGVLSCQY